MKTKKPVFDHTLDQCYAALDKAERNGANLVAEELYLLALALDGGLFGLDTDHRRAVALMRQAAEMDHAAACDWMALELYDLTSEKPIPDEPLRYMKRAADLGYTRSKVNLAILIIRGSAKEEMEGQVLRLLTEAADQLEDHSMGLLAFYLIESMPKSDETRELARFYAALELTLEEDTVLSEHLDMFFTEADCIDDGSIDLRRIIFHAADHGNALAKYARYMLLTSDNDGVFKGDTEESAALLREAAEGATPMAMERIALQKIGEPEPDYAAIMKLLERPIELRMDQAQLACAMLKLHEGTPLYNVDEGIKLLEQANNTGLPLALMATADLVQRGIVNDPYGCREDFFRYAALDEN